MLKAEGQMELAVLRKHGASIRELARMTGQSRNTVRRYLRGGEIAERRKPTAKRAEKLDDFKDYIVDRMRARRRHGYQRPFFSARSRSRDIGAARRG
jgi:transposase